VHDRPLPFMLSDNQASIVIRPMAARDFEAVASLIASIENFNQAEVECALELVDIYLNNKNQNDYRIVVAEDSASAVCGYACWGPVPLTSGTYDLYWIATRRGTRGHGYGQALMAHVEDRVREDNGRLLVVETSGKSSYEGTVGFYRRLGYEEVSRIEHFYDVGDDRLIFVKRLP
jgi:ribosomal protein S18 acetylase RimI-like enzyme